MKVVKRVRFNSPTNTLVTEILDEIRNAATLITPIDTVILYNAGAQVASGSITTTTVNTDGSITASANIQNTGLSNIVFDEIAIASGSKEYYRKTLPTQYSIAPGDTLILDILINHLFQIDPSSNYSYFALQQDMGIVLSRRLTGQQITRMNITGGEAIDTAGNVLPATMNVGTPSGNSIQIQFSLLAPFLFDAVYFGVKINGLTPNPSGPSGYALLYNFPVTISNVTRVVNLTIWIQ